VNLKQKDLPLGNGGNIDAISHQMILFILFIKTDLHPNKRKSGEKMRFPT
jgi:hypothetical protein